MNQERMKIAYAAELVGGSCGMSAIFIGIGILIYVVGSFSIAFFNNRNPGDSVTSVGIALMLTGFAGCYGSYLFFRNYFRRKYGFVAGKATNYKRLVLGVLAVALTSGLTRYIDSLFYLPTSLTVLTFAAFAFYLWKTKHRYFSNILLYFSAMLLFASFLPWNQIFLMLEPTNVFRHPSYLFGEIFPLLIGLTGVVAGGTEFLIVSKTLKPIAREEKIYESV